MKRKKAKQAARRGRRKFKSKSASEKSAFEPYGQHPRPYGWAWPVFDIANRPSLLRFFLPVIKGDEAVPDVPLNFAQVADQMLGQKQLLMKNPQLSEELLRYQSINDSQSDKHPCWNYPEIPPTLLRDALARCAAWTVQEYQIVQRALARLYAVAWFGRGPESVEAKRQLEALLPPGKEYPISKWIPELADKFRQRRGWILKSNELMKQEFPREIDRVKKLAELYAESTAVISAALRQAETPFLAELLAAVLGIPAETVRKALPKQPAS